MAGCGKQETFRQALRDCQWQRVGQMVLQGSSLEQRDVAVSQAVSHSQWGLVSHLVQLGISQKCRDLAVHKAVRYCLWDIVDDLVAAGVSSEKRDFLLQRGLRHGQWALVSCLLSLGVGLELRGVVVTTALEHGQWGLVLDALRVGVKQELVTKVFQEVVSQKRWEHVPSLGKIFNNNDHTDFVLQEAIRSCQWVCVRQLIKTGLTPAQQGLVCREALEWAHLDCAVELLRQGCEQGCAERIVLEVFRSNRCQVLVDLIKECDTRPSVRDVILRTAKNYEKWYLVILNSYLDHCEDTSFTDLAFKNAASDGQWDIVNSLLPRFSQDSDLLCEVLQCAVRSGQSEVCESLLLVVDLRQSDYYSIRSVFDDAVTSSGDREQMVKLCVRFGLATHVNPCNCSSQYNYCFCSSLPMKTALRNGQMPLVKLLYKSGACSENQLFFYKQDTSLRILLQGQGRDDIVEYLDHVATTPRTLQDLCRLQVSRHIGCHPGRLGRVMALEISWPAKDLINFEDVLS